MMTLTRSLFVSRRSMALCAVLGAGLTMANAQQTVNPAASAPQAVTPQAPSAEPLTYSSSSADNQVAMAETTPFDKFLAEDGTQPPPRRTYGRPRYRGGNQNADGSNKWAFEVGAGAAIPVGDFNKFTNLSYGFSVGGGRNFNKNFGVTIDYNYDRFGFKAATINNQLGIYDGIFNVYNSMVPPSQQVDPPSQLDGNTHIHSISVNPTFSVAPREGMGVYLTGGVGFYHKVADFTVPGTVCDPYYGVCYESDQILDHYFSNAPGFDGGIGLTYKMGRFSEAKWYVEAKYVYLMTSQRAGLTSPSQVNSTTWTTPNDYPANSNRTAYMPVKFGIRF